MQAAARKWATRLLWVLAGLLVLYGVVRLSDWVWYRSQLPVGFQDANWSGTWQTEKFHGFAGRLLVRLPDPLPENQDFKAEALVYYPVYSAWKTGQFVKMDFVGRFSPDAPASAGQSTNTIPGGGKLKFKGTVNNQVVEYVAIIDPSRARIVGGYLSRTPNDYGLFSIRYY